MTINFVKLNNTAVGSVKTKYRKQFEFGYLRSFGFFFLLNPLVAAVSRAML
jgi:hypothetical protein